MPRRKLVWKLLPFYFLICSILIGATLFAGRVIWPPGGPEEAGAGDALADLVSLGAFCLVIALLGTSVIFFVIYRINRTLELTRLGARRFAEGDLEFRLPVPTSEEMGGLAETLNQMAAQLDDRISTISHQRNQLDAVLSSMIEGLIALDEEERVLQVNRAACGLLGIQPELVIGRNVREVIRNIDLHQMLRRTLADHAPAEGEIVFYGTEERCLQVHCTPLRDDRREAIGALIVFNDITKLRRLERVRRDFVANVSHELKTPLTSIKGFVETLQDGAMHEPTEARRFLGIIHKKVDRIQAIIEDLLMLSRVEQVEEAGGIAMQPHRLRDILENAVQTCGNQAAAKQIEIGIECEPDLILHGNAALLEQAVMNLIDNAVKYSDPGTAIGLRAGRADDQCRLTVQDQGYGIDARHLPRIFERFYRVDKARSRNIGGTGLGLSIVKHVVQAHNGAIQVDSKLGQGTTFTIRLPLAPGGPEPAVVSQHSIPLLTPP